MLNFAFRFAGNWKIDPDSTVPFLYYQLFTSGHYFYLIWKVNHCSFDNYDLNTNKPIDKI